MPRTGTEPLTPPLGGSAYLRSAAVEWQPTDAPKFWIKPIYEDPAGPNKTYLMKIDPGAFYPSHAHDAFEQIYVLEGSFYDDERTLKAGDYACRAPGALHTAGSRDGAIVLVIYSAPVLDGPRPDDAPGCCDAGS